MQFECALRAEVNGIWGKAQRWFQRAAEQGVRSAEPHVAWLLHKESAAELDSKALEFYLDVASSGDTISQLNVAAIYERAANFSAAAHW